MACYHPLTAWRSKDVNPASGKRGLVFQEKYGMDNSQLEVACGQCVGCRMDNARNWATRIMHERRSHDLCTFLTLTYDNHNLPSPPSLDKKHFQLFMKRLRKYIWQTNPDNPKIKYYMCGEYGGNTRRPHYHAIIFGLDFADKTFVKFTKNQDKLYKSEKLNELWGLGYCWIGSVSYASAGYCARYCIKKVNGQMAEDHYSYVNTQTGEIAVLAKEYMACSNRLGLDHFLEHHEEMYRHDYVIVNGHQAPIPKYYDVKLGEIDPEKLEQIKEERVKRAKLRKEDNTRERLEVREEVKKAQVKQLRRDLE